MRHAVVIGGPFNGQIIPLAGIKVRFPFVDHRGYFNVAVPWTVLGQDRYAAFWEDGETSRGWELPQ